MITDHAQKALGDVVFVELPVHGTEVQQGGAVLGMILAYVAHGS